MNQIILSVIFIIYLSLGYKIPHSIASKINTLIGKIVIFIITLFLIIKVHPILSILSLIVAVDIIYKSSRIEEQTFKSDNEYKMTQFNSFNNFHYTLEQEMVKKMTPPRGNEIYNDVTYKPVLENTYNATHINV